MKIRLNTRIQHPQHRTLWSATLLTFFLMFMVATSEAAVRATLDRDSVYTGNPFTLTIESDGRQSGPQPNLAPLEKDFKVLGTSTSTQVSIFNGQRSDKILWQIQLLPRHSGQVRIPAIALAGQQTAPIDLKISDAPQTVTSQTGQHVFIKAEINSTSKQTYVQQQIPYTVRLYYDGLVQEGEFSAPELKNAVVEQLGEDKNYSTMINGQQYNVIERNYVISPEKSGSLHILPATFNGRIAVPQQRNSSRRTGSMMERFLGNSVFANDPFFRNSMLNDDFFNNTPFGNPGKPITVHSRSIKINIQPRPVTASHNWLPAEAVTLSDSWAENPPKIKAGEPVSRTITIQTKGLSGSQIPELTIATPTNARLYPETRKQESRTDGKTIYGVRKQTMTYIANAQGMLEVPVITLNWWNTHHNKAVSTTLPARRFKVSRGSISTENEAQVIPLRNSAGQQNTTAQTKNKATQTKTEAGFAESIKANWLKLLIGGGLLIALLVVIIAWHTRLQRKINMKSIVKQNLQPKPQPRPKTNQKPMLRSLEIACKANDQHAAAKALLSLALVRWPDAPPRNLNALATRVTRGQAQLKELDRILYAANTSHWNGTQLWNEFKSGFQVAKITRHNQDDGLHPLYPQHS